MALTQIIGDGLKSTLAIGSEGGAVTTSVQQGLAKAWVQTASGAAPSDSLNISGVVDNSTGNYTVSFSSAMANDDYSPTATRITPGANLLLVFRAVYLSLVYYLLFYYVYYFTSGTDSYSQF